MQFHSKKTQIQDLELLDVHTLPMISTSETKMMENDKQRL
jgi:hypothetical protein